MADTGTPGPSGGGPQPQQPLATTTSTGAGESTPLLNVVSSNSNGSSSSTSSSTGYPKVDITDISLDPVDGATHPHTHDTRGYEIAIVYKNPKTDDDGKIEDFQEVQAKRQKREETFAKLRAVDLIVNVVESQDKTESYALITAMSDRLEDHAEFIGLQLKLKEEFGGGYATFQRVNRHMFQGTFEQHKDKRTGFFRLTRRQQLITSIIEMDADEGGAEIDLKDLEHHGVFDKVFNLHSTRTTRELMEDWIKKPLRRTPIQAIRNYFGEELAFYYAFILFYTKWLVFAGGVGLVAFILNHVLGDIDGMWVNSAYSIFIAIWATMVLEFWKRERNYRVRQWNMFDFKTSEATRPGYRGEERLGVWVNGEFVPLAPGEQYGPTAPKPIKYFDPNNVRNRTLMALSVVVIMAVMVVAATIAVLTVRIFIQNRYPNEDWTTIVGGILNAVVIMVLNKVYRFIAVKLNNWENHRTQSSYENHLILKIFLFQFVNSYTSLYYIAFFKRNTYLWGDDALKDTCGTTEDDAADFGWGCPNQLSLQLLTLLATNIVVGQAQEVIIPWVTAKLKILWIAHKMDVEEDRLPKYERQRVLTSFDTVLDDYSEMVIQYGYITLFAASFPLAPLLALVNNVIEMRTDGFKWLTSYNKPQYREADDIGLWFLILEVVGVMAVITNCLLIGFTFRNIYDISRSTFAVLLVIVLLEHIVLFLKFIVSVLTPDMPAVTKQQLAKQHYIRQQLFKKYNLSRLAHEEEKSENAKQVQEQLKSKVA